MPVKNLRQRKSELRAKYRKLRERLDREKKKELDKSIVERFLSLPEYKSANTIFAFISKDIEVDTSLIINDAFMSGKKVAVPRCNADNTTMEFYYISSLDDLEKGCYGLLEPDTKRCPKALRRDADVMIIPGLVFDRGGYRLGFGKGYYDRYLYEYKGFTVGICYSRCIENELPLGRFDRPINMVITDKYLIDTR